LVQPFLSSIIGYTKFKTDLLSFDVLFYSCSLVFINGTEIIAEQNYNNVKVKLELFRRFKKVFYLKMKLRAAHKSQMCFFTNMEILLFDQLELCPVFTLPVDVSKTGKN
jgi:hypothetical protein